MYVLPHCGRSISFPFQNISGIQEDIKDCLLICYCDIGCIFLRDLSALRNIIILNGKKNFSAESFCLSPGIFLPDNICLIQEELPPEVCVQSLEAGFLKQLPDRLEQPIYSSICHQNAFFHPIDNSEETEALSAPVPQISVSI